MLTCSPMGSSGCALCTAATRSAAPSMLIMADVEVTTPSRHACTRPSLTPSVRPRSSALTIKTRFDSPADTDDMPLDASSQPAGAGSPPLCQRYARGDVGPRSPMPAYHSAPGTDSYVTAAD